MRTLVRLEKPMTPNLTESIDVLGSKIEKVSDKLIELISFNNYNSNRA